MTDTKKRKDMSLGLADAADRIAKLLSAAPERRHKALEKADADEVAAIQTALDKLVARVPAGLRGKLVSVLGAMDVEVVAPFVVGEEEPPWAEDTRKVQEAIARREQAEPAIPPAPVEASKGDEIPERLRNPLPPERLRIGQR